MFTAMNGKNKSHRKSAQVENEQNAETKMKNAAARIIIRK